MRLTSIIVLSVLFVSGCAMRLSAPDYLTYVSNNEQLFKVETATEVNYQLVYSPVEQVVAENLESFSNEEAKAELKKMKEVSNSFFKLKIVVPSGNLFSQHAAPKQEQMEYYSVSFKDQIQAVTATSDTLNCRGYFFQANAGFGNSSYFEFEFPQNVDKLKHILLYPKYLEDSAIVIPLSALHHKYPELKIKK